MSTHITIQNVSSIDAVPDEKQIQRWVSAALDGTRNDTEITLRIVDENEGRTLNKIWRHKDYATNVLSFPVGETIEQAPGLLGDIVVCAPVVLNEASEQGKAVDAHWAHLVVHGMLHLQGYDHEQEEDAKKMEALEITILGKIGYANPYETELES